MLTISSLQNKRIVVLGLGLTGMSFVRFLTNNALDFVVNDSREQHGQFAELRQEHPEVQLFTGKWHADVIIVMYFHASHQRFTTPYSQ